MMWLALIAAWAWFCLVFVDDNPMTAFWLMPVVLPFSVVAETIELCNRKMFEFVDFCVGLESGK